MTIFGNYSAYYNLLYKDKDYKSEVNYIDMMIKKYLPKAQSILDLGCGTGKHDFLLAEKGYHVSGVDRSKDMLAEANKQLELLKSSNPPAANKLDFHQGDIRSFRLKKRFDVIILLFHVISYQITNEDLLLSFETILNHLKPEGIIIFDFWYAPTVMSVQPSVRVKRLEDDKIRITRIAEPVIHHRENIVDVNYQIFIQNKESSLVKELNEHHRMRYLSEPEINLLLSQKGFEIIDAAEFLSHKPLGANTWSACIIGKLSDEQ